MNLEDLKNGQVPLCMKWAAEDVAEYVEYLGFPQYKDCFISNNINGRRLILMDASHLPKIGIRDFDHIKIIAAEIRKIINIEDPDYWRSICEPPRSCLGMYLELKSRTGTKIDELTYAKMSETFDDTIWQPPLANIGLILPR